MLTVIETPIFQRMVQGIWSQAEREAFVVYISDNPTAGDVIPPEQRVCAKCAGNVMAWEKAVVLG